MRHAILLDWRGDLIVGGLTAICRSSSEDQSLVLATSKRRGGSGQTGYDSPVFNLIPVGPYSRAIFILEEMLCVGPPAP